VAVIGEVRSVGRPCTAQHVGAADRCDRRPARNLL